jgi:hypothetical protein
LQLSLLAAPLSFQLGDKSPQLMHCVLLQDVFNADVAIHCKEDEDFDFSLRAQVEAGVTRIIKEVWDVGG